MNAAISRARLTPLAEMQDGLRKLSGPSSPGEHLKSIIRRAAREAGLEFWRAHAIWYGRARRIDATELDRVRAKLAHQQQENKEFADEISAIRARLARLEALLAQEDSPLPRETELADRRLGREGLAGVVRAA